MPSFATIGFLISTLAVAASAIGTPLPAAGFEQGHFYINHSGTEGCLNDDGKWTLKDCGLFTVEGKGQAAGNWNSVGVRNSRGEKCSIGDNLIFHCSHSTPAAWNQWVYRLTPDPEVLVTNFQYNTYRTDGNKTPTGSEALEIFQDGDPFTGGIYELVWVRS